MIRDIGPRKDIRDLRGDVTEVVAQLTDEDHDGPRVQVRVFIGSSLESVAFFSPDDARQLARTLVNEAAHAESAFGTIR